MTFVRQEGSKVRFQDTAPFMQPIVPWSVMVEPFAGSAAVSLKFAEIYPDIALIIADNDEPIANVFSQVQSNVAEMQQYARAYLPNLQAMDTTNTLWLEWVESRDNPKAFSPPHRAALRFHAGPICSPTALNRQNNRNGFSPARAGFNGYHRWDRAASHQIDRLSYWSQRLHHADIRRADYREVLAEQIASQKTAFFFLDPPYRFAKNGKESASRLYYGADFNVDEFGTWCSRLDDAGHLVMVTLDWSERNVAMFDGNWTVIQASWKSYGGSQSTHLVAINYTPITPIEEVIIIKGWKLAQQRGRHDPHLSKHGVMPQVLNQNP
jgi:site-specific DNA-adenine methylase